MNGDRKTMRSLFGSAFLLARIDAGKQQNEIARLAGIDASYLAAIERGRKRPPARGTLDRLLQALHLSEERQRKLKSLAVIDRLLEAAESPDDLDETVVRITKHLRQAAQLDERDWITVNCVVSALVKAQTAKIEQ
jgi:transcriptional regulator with XRE-family HTH domain